MVVLTHAGKWVYRVSLGLFSTTESMDLIAWGRKQRSWGGRKTRRPPWIKSNKIQLWLETESSFWLRFWCFSQKLFGYSAQSMSPLQPNHESEVKGSQWPSSGRVLWHTLSVRRESLAMFVLVSHPLLTIERRRGRRKILPLFLRTNNNVLDFNQGGTI